MPRPKQFNLLVVKDDGSRVLRLTVPGWTVATTAGAIALAVLGLAVIYPDYFSLRGQRSGFAALNARLAAQQALLSASETRMREIRDEIDGWRQLHVKIWEPFGPEAGPMRRGAGIGGGGGTTGAAAEGDRAAVKEEMDRLAALVKEEGDSLRTLERFLGKAGRVLASLPSRWPLRGPINSDFGQRRSPWAPNSEFHGGIDIGAPVGTPVKAPAPGTVLFAGARPEYGTTLILDHGNNTTSLYGHLSRLNVMVGQPVRRGDIVALTGNTGRSSGPHLHYEIQVKGQPVNPHSYIWEDPGPVVAKGASR